MPGYFVRVTAATQRNPARRNVTGLWQWSEKEGRIPFCGDDVNRTYDQPSAVKRQTPTQHRVNVKDMIAYTSYCILLSWDTFSSLVD